MSETNTKSHPLLRILGFVAFVVAVGLIVWIAILTVRAIPNAFDALVSISDRVHTSSTTPTVTLTISDENIESGETVDLAWNETIHDGTYTFSYTCSDGVAVALIDANSEREFVQCGVRYELEDSPDSLRLLITSERNRVAGITLSVVLQDVAGKIVAGDSKPLFIVNPLIIVTNEETDLPSATTTPVVGDEDENDVAEHEVSVPPVYWTYVPVYTIPVSNPYGYTDLAVRLMGVGYVTHDKLFIKTDRLHRDRHGAVQYEIKNLGTKTSENWTYDLLLPSGEKITSKQQQPLRPNERSILTISFDTGNKTGVRAFDMEIHGGDDRNLSNNNFFWAVEIRR